MSNRIDRRDSRFKKFFDAGESTARSEKKTDEPKASAENQPVKEKNTGRGGGFYLNGGKKYFFAKIKKTLDDDSLISYI